MPVNATLAVRYVFWKMAVDMERVSCLMTLRRLINDQPDGEVEFEVSGASLLPIFAAEPNAGMSRADDMAQAVYEYAVASGIIDGEVS